MSDDDARFGGSPARERMFNAPLAVIVIAVALPVLFFLQMRLPDLGAGMAFVPADLQQGGWGGLFSYMLIHGGWGHVLMNAVGVLAFGTPVARQFGPRYGSSVFLLFFVVCGAAAALGYGLIHWGSTASVGGASGAVFGLIGAATRLLGGHGRVLPLLDRRVVTMSLVWMAVNAFTGLIGFAPGLNGAQIAWEAHAVGFLVGLIAIGPLGRVFGRVALAV
ncbi:rhomboid family intramembrane serine protease [Brevundimonas sp. SORGH_AS_0993]|uniref:rhomboid family intramembrane serine protease n=1 Tax=Brevundimonas sp. SORGH_AS_0993 TaxID=3041794 RepID=UPI002789F8D9|nr:rhomboid family intramembrane serine protease [Brevundimonas sp. SORGH_AS_0993]MDQ1155304.1 membrane associated rhomboid family serine protease [Brevundimonas sp. SORGH_AS_0993]